MSEKKINITKLPSKQGTLETANKLLHEGLHKSMSAILISQQEQLDCFICSKYYLLICYKHTYLYLHQH